MTRSRRHVEHDLVELEILDERALREELRRGRVWRRSRRATIAETDDHAGSEVVIARA